MKKNVSPFSKPFWYLTIIIFLCSFNQSFAQTATISGTSTICSGGSTTFSVTFTGSLPYNFVCQYTDGMGNYYTSPTITCLTHIFTVSPTSNTTYNLISVTNNSGLPSYSVSGSAVITVNPLPAADAGSLSTICSGGSAGIGAAGVGGDTYSWASSPTDASFSNTTISNPTVSPTTTTSYTLTETITSTGCTSANSVIITVFPQPIANAGSAQTTCTGTGVTIGASTVGADTYSWTSTPTDPTFYTTSVSNPTVSPTITTTYGLTETIPTTGCTKTNSVKVTVNPLPAANAGSNQAICNGGSVGIGAGAVGTDTYFWTSTPTDPTFYTTSVSNPTVSPTITTTYSLVETITATGCTKTNSVVVTVNPLPAANAGSAQTTCSGIGIAIGASPVGGDSYSWTGPSISSTTSSNPTVSPTTTTVYSLTETIISTGCTNTNTVAITVNPLPEANPGSNISICSGNTTIIGSSGVDGDTYSWTSNPSGFTDYSYEATVFPTTTITYYLTETTTATGCSSTNDVIITVATPAANAGSDASFCDGSNITIGAAPVGGDTYSWISMPSDPTFYTTALSNPNVSPIITTTYTLTESNSLGCTNSNNVVVTVNPVPAANAGSNQTSCSGSSVSIGASSVGSDTYSWTSSPSDPSLSTTASNPAVSPTTTTNYTLIETTPPGCTNTNSVAITVNPIPNSILDSSNALICVNDTVIIGDDTTSGYTYNWTANPSGATPTGSYGLVEPTVSTTYLLTETITATGCSISDSIVVIVDTIPAAIAGSASTICSGSNITIGATAVSGIGYAWYSNPYGFRSDTANPTVSPTVTTTYYLFSFAPAGCENRDSVVITVLPAPAADVGTDSIITNCDATHNSITIGASAISGHSYSWTSSPSGFTSTSANPTATPTVNTTYYFTETITATGCTKSNVLHVALLPSNSHINLKLHLNQTN